VTWGSQFTFLLQLLLDIMQTSDEHGLDARVVDPRMGQSICSRSSKGSGSGWHRSQHRHMIVHRKVARCRFTGSVSLDRQLLQVVSALGALPPHINPLYSACPSQRSNWSYCYSVNCINCIMYPALLGSLMTNP
jgi:hypothetical protein